MTKAGKFRNTKVKETFYFEPPFLGTPNPAEALATVRRQVQLERTLPECDPFLVGILLGWIFLVGWGSLSSGKMCSNQLINSSWVTLEDSSKMHSLFFFNSVVFGRTCRRSKALVPYHLL